MGDDEEGRPSGGRKAVAPGRIKGSAFVGVVKVLRMAKEEGRRATPPELQHYLTARILLSSWYPERDAVELIRAMTRIWQPKSGRDPWEEVGRVVVAEFASGAYKGLFRVGDPLGTLRNYPLQWKLRHDTGEMTIVPEGEGRARVELVDYDLPSPDYCRSLGGSMLGLLEIAGAEGIAVEKSHCTANGDPSCVWLASWS
jgi:hypothetical protein